MSAFNPEDSLLRAMMADNATYWRVAEIVCADDFTPKARALYAAIEKAVRDGAAADAVTLAETLGDALGREAMDIATHASGSIANAESYARLIAQRGEAKRVREAGQRIALVDSYAEAQSLLAAVRPQQTTRLKDAEAGLGEMLAVMQTRFKCESGVTGVPTGLESLDAITGGWQAGDLIGLGGSTSSGKTAFALQSALAAGRCYYASLEMMAAQLYERVVSNVGQIPYRYIRFPLEAPEGYVDKGGRLYETINSARALPLIVDDQPGLSVEQISARARQLHMVKPLRLVVVDHLNLVRRPRKNDAAELGEISIALKNLGKELGVPVLVLVQFNRGVGKERPELAHFRNSGEIEENLDTAVMVYREEYHNPGGPLKGYAEFIVRKQRQGERNVTAWAKSYLSQMRFESCDEPEQRAGNAESNEQGGGFASRFGKGPQPSRVSATGVPV